MSRLPVDTSRRTAGSLAVIAFFSLLLVGTSKAPPRPTTAPGVPPPPGSASLPSSAAWAWVEAPELGLRLRLPPGWTLERAAKGPAGYGLTVRPPAGGPIVHLFDAAKNPIDFEAIERDLAADLSSGAVELLVRDTSVLVAAGRSAARTGCFASACNLDAPRLCVNGVGFPEDAGRGMTEDECLETAAMVHSLQRMPGR